MNMPAKEKGSITIYMTLMFSIMLSLFLTVIDGARRNAISMQAECAFDLSVYSIFAEYNKQLLEQYDLLFVDASYGESKPSIERTEHHFAYYLNENLSSAKKGKLPATDLTQTFLESCEVHDLSFATDDGGAVFQRQAILFMEQKYGISYVKELQNELKKAEDHNLFTRDITAERNANQGVIDATEIPPKETGKKDEDGNPILEDVSLDNPADGVNASRPKGILYLVTQAQQELSEQMIQKEQCVSQRQLFQAGNGVDDRDGVSAAQKLLFDAYIMDHFGTYVEPKEKGQLMYQVEYIIAGKNNDIDNLKAIVNRLLLLRETANFTYLLTDGAKLAEAEALAAAVTSAAGVPLLLEPVKLSLLFAWAYAESVYDVRCLLAGKRVPLIKTFETWHFSLEGMLHYESMMDVASENGDTDSLSGQDTIFSLKDGLSYEDYLRLFLALRAEREKINGAMDMAEADIRRTKGNESFRLDGCIDKMTLEACVGSRFGPFHEMKRTFYYK